MTKRYVIEDNKAIVDTETMTPNGIPTKIFVAEDPFEANKICKELNEQDQKIKKLKEENRLLDIEDERWVKASEQDEETINKLNKENQKLTHEIYLEKGSTEYYKQLSEEYFEEISKLTYELNKLKDKIEY